MWEFVKILPIFLIFQEKQIYTVGFKFRDYCVCVYIYIIHIYMNYVQSTDIRVMLVGNYINKFTNTVRHKVQAIPV